MKSHAKPGFFIFLSALTVVHECFAQQDFHFEPLSIDRPDISNLPTTVLPGQFQFELGTEWASGPRSTEFYLPNMVVRTGLGKKAELRLGVNHLALDSSATLMSDDVLFLSIGAKYRFVEEDGLRPSIAIQPEFSLPFGDGVLIRRDNPNYSLADYSIVFLFNNTLHKQIFINYNAGVFWSREGRVDYLLSASASFLHTHRVGYYIEPYTLIEESGAFPLSFNGGLMFLVTPRIQFDVYAGNRGVDGLRFWFGGGGIGFRIDPGDMSPKNFHKTGISH